MIDLAAMRNGPPPPDVPRKQIKTYLSEAARLRLYAAAGVAGVPMYRLLEELIFQHLPVVRFTEDERG